MADALVKHAFVSAVAEGSDPTKIRTSNWNAALLFSDGADGQVLTRSAASATGAAWSAAATGVPTGVAAGSALVSNGVGLAPVWSATPALSGLTVTGETGGGAIATRKTAVTITAAQGLYDVGLRLRTLGTGTYSALDIDLLSETFAGGRGMRLFTNQAGTRSQVVYFNNGGALYSRVGIIVSGTWTGSGEDTNITPPSLDPHMIGVWGDVIGGIQVRAANVAGPWLWEGLDRSGNKTSSINEDGSLWFGAGATRAAMDVGIKRVSAGVLEINSTVAGTTRDLNLRTLTAAAGSAASPSIKFADDVNTGFYKSSSTILDIAIGGVQTFRFSGGGLFFAASAGRMVASSAGAFSFSSGIAGVAVEDVFLRRVGAGQCIFTNATPVGVGLDVNTDAVMKVRTRAHTGYATVDALGYSVSGVAGASKAAGPVASITVVNGIVTAIS